ncbi:MAG: four helix bundle protein [Pseudomonadota bacterium]
MAFQKADELALAVYRVTAAFPVEERFGLAQQMRRAAVSVASNIVEGCARSSEADYLRFLDMAFASSRELGYQIPLAHKLKLLPNEQSTALVTLSDEASKLLRGLIRGINRGTTDE